MGSLRAWLRRGATGVAGAMGVLLILSGLAAPGAWAAGTGGSTSAPVAVVGTSARPTAAGAFIPISPARLLDTRTSTPVGPDGTVSFQVGGMNGIPAAAAAVVFNLTVTGPQSFGFITAYASGAARPNSSNVNFAAGQTVPNSVTVPVGVDGKVTLFNRSSGSTQLIADVSGYYLPGTPTVPGAFVPIAPARLLDTRGSTPAGPDGTVSFQVGGVGGIPASVSAVSFNLTVANPTSFGFITAYASGTTRPNSSNINFATDQTVPNSVTVPVGVDGKVTLFNRSSGSTQLIADVAGYFLSGTPSAPGAFVPVNPARLLDTRSSAPAGPDGTVSFRVGGAGGIPANVAAAVFNLTVTGPQSFGFITAYASGSIRPNASNVNFASGQTVPSSVTVPVGADGKITLFNRSDGATQLIADVAGYYLPGASSGSAVTWGNNQSSQLGNGTTPYLASPAAVTGLSGVKSIAGDGSTSYALLADGTVRAWGSNQSGQLGNGTTNDSSIPVQVQGLSGVTSITINGRTAYALLGDGTVRAWGESSTGQLGSGITFSSTPLQIQGLTGVTAITATYYGAYALLNDGTVRAWGSNFVGQLGNGTTGIGSSAPAQVTGLTGVAAVTASDFSAYALLSDGTVRAWGDNSSGQLGSGTSANSSNRPVQVQGLSGVTSIVASNYNAYALLADRTVRSWGANGSGQLGNGTTSESYTPVRVQGISNVMSMAAGKGSVYAVLGDGTARAWGLNQSGQLGTGTTTNSTTAIQVSGLTTALSITAGKGDTNNPVAYAVLRDGTVRAWGVNPTGQLGNGSTANSNVPTQVTGLTGLAGTASISAARGTAFAVLADGTIRAWGDNYNHQLGVTGTTSFSNVPLGVTGLSGVAMGAQGPSTKYAALVNGTAWAWGGNSFGQLGNGTTSDSSVPVQVSGLSGVVSITASGGTAYALLGDGTVWAWGDNSSGQLGNATTSNSSVPVQVQGVTGAGSIIASGGSAYAVLTDGTVRAWGSNQSGQLGNGTNADSNTPVQVTGLTGVSSITASYGTAYAVLADGTVRAWGYNGYGQLGNGTNANANTPVQVSGLAGAVSLAANGGTAYAVLGNGTVRAWGAGTYGELGNGTASSSVPVQVPGLTAVASVAASEISAYAVLKDGTVRAWGANWYGQLGNGTTTDSPAPVQVQGLTGVSSLACTMYDAFAVLSDGTVRAWGDNAQGQLGNGAATSSNTPVQVQGLTGVTSLWP
ncbi:RCC1 domain-containing protein [Arthrobacter bambusae]|uniref:RCC1 domain-containing protein n=1 Tax=Arthrobacter bambusae TaxID=1338426 RepID=UPI0027895FA3|nr:hypothetical protein [Arthrobacter bambusae]MDQ0241601.1 alpha-tubulin suppressor-like RCC1 family protein [Arthrobacter bambusae]